MTKNALRPSSLTNVAHDPQTLHTAIAETSYIPDAKLAL